MSMQVKQWIANLSKSAGPKKPSVSPGIAQVAAVSLVVLLAVGAIIVVAHQATPSASTSAKSATVSAAAPAAAPVTATAKKTNASPKAKTANGATSAQAVPEIVTITGCLEQKGDE